MAAELAGGEFGNGGGKPGGVQMLNCSLPRGEVAEDVGPAGYDGSIRPPFGDGGV